MNIGIFLIATNKYISFIPELKAGLDKYFLTDFKKTIYLFTDSNKIPKGIEKVYQEHKEWPYPTLYRYHIIKNFTDKEHIKHDYYYYFDADMLIADKVGDEVLGKIVATIHPGFYNKNKKDLFYERNFLTKSYVNPNIIENYYAGGFNGGSKYLGMAGQIIKWVDVDQKYNYTPCWHDECYLNKFLALNKPDVILSPEYCMPQTTDERKQFGLSNINPKIIAITKLRGFR